MKRKRRTRIAWCGECGNTSVDGVNFGTPNLDEPWILQCMRCGTKGPWAFYREAYILHGMYETTEFGENLKDW